MTAKQQANSDCTLIQPYNFVLPHKTISYAASPGSLREVMEDIRDTLFWDKPGEHKYHAYFYVIAQNGFFEPLNENNYRRGTIYMRFITNASDPPKSKESYVHVHACIECDSCGIKPIIGSRYKCTRCPDYNQCEICELKRQHGEHALVRMAERKIYCTECGLPAGVHGFVYTCCICPHVYLCKHCELRRAHNYHKIKRVTVDELNVDGTTDSNTSTNC